MRALRSLAISLIALVVCCAPQQAAKKYTIHVPHLTGELDNGMQVIVLPDATTDLVEVDVRYEVGSNEDPPGKEGLAHLVEHLMFQQRAAGEDQPPIRAALRRASLYTNAFTIWDSTHYQVLARKSAFEEIVSLEAARMATGCQAISQAEFERERE